jgi:hypothetical protein
MNMLVIEDDYLQANWIQENLLKAFPGSKIEHIATELDFRSKIDSLVKHPPAVIIMDVMLRWTDPSPDMTPPPEDVIRGKFHRAGVRCKKLLLEHNATKDIPLILYSVLEAADLQKEIQELGSTLVHVPKESDPWSLIAKIREVSGKHP